MNQIQMFFQLASDRSDLLLDAFWQHIEMSLISLLIAVFIAVPLGIFLAVKRTGAEPVIGSTAVLQTIPSLALLGFLIPFVGIGTTPAIIALTAYALMPILRNTFTGVKGVDPALTEAARGMGMSYPQMLFKVQLPLAMPTIMAGIRTGMVLIVGTATLAALVGAGGLGDLIMTGLNRSNNYYILLGAIPAALLAVFLDIILRQTEKRSSGASIRPIFVIVALALLLVTAPYGYRLAVGGGEDDEIVIAGKLGAEPEIVINMYKLLIEAETDYSVELEPGLGTTDIVFEATRSGDIDGYFEFTGTAITTLLEEDPVSNNEQEAYEQARDGMLEQYGLVFLEPMDYQNTYALAVTEEFAESEGVETISDLIPYEEDLTAAFTFEFYDREADGYPAIQNVYGLDFEDVQTMDPGLRSGALVSGDVQVIDAYSTDSYMIEYNLVTMEDDENVFPPFNGAPLFREDVLINYPEIEDVLNVLGGRITEDEMMQMNYEVDVNDADASDVARNYLVEEGLLPGESE
ncbi:ABC transporter permease/substrate-binding protein [Alkalicoccus urumqiensis]|uniref:Glycine/betaine ABC transporter permease n=1 Tax=Alkalicoccus urumqiensis TaxID=1548213 RepID=A0A2P6MDR6_ALKUR|nr:ABC transporter permease/substrate-binding protein [Alkalicoccus urumqiensis]PRO64422.1 glycine/betaine ABC transporter permease [Alkalicoccus urumqiensis]